MVSLILKKGLRGFTLVELMVALFIMSVSTVLLLANYPDSTVRLNLLNNAHSFALLVREAQLRGSAIDSASSTVSGYGIFINSATSSVAILFSDATDNSSGIPLKSTSGFPIGDGLYDTAFSPKDSIKNTLQLKDTFTFKKLCVASSTATGPRIGTSSFLCTKVNATDITPIKTLTISFTRPSQVAHIYVNNATSSDFSKACIQLYSLKTPKAGHIRSVVVSHSGVITTTATACE